MAKDFLSAQMIYINKFDLDKSKKLSDYLTFVPAMEQFGEGYELSHLFQSAYKIAPNKNLQLKTILNVQNPDKILLNLQKGYFESYFSISEVNNFILKMSNQLFIGSKPIDGIAKKALELAILKSGKNEPTLKNRL